jgi:hypothetical protein
MCVDAKTRSKLLGHLHLNRISDQLFSRTPPAILNREHRAKLASPGTPSIPANEAASRSRNLQGSNLQRSLSLMVSLAISASSSAPRPAAFSSTIDLLLLCFQNLTNPSSHNSRVFTSIQNPRSVGPFGMVAHDSHLTTHRARITNRAFSSACTLFVSLCALFCLRSLCFQSFARSFAKYPGVGYVGQPFLAVLRRSSPRSFPTTDSRNEAPFARHPRSLYPRASLT